MRPLQPAANATIACVAVAALSAAIAIPASRLGGTAPLTEAWSVVDLVTLATALAGAVCFIVWLTQARRNLDLLPTTDPTWATNWSTGAWFMPMAQYAIAPLVMSHIVTETLAGTDSTRRNRLILLARAWWISLIVAALFIYQLADRHTSPPPATVDMATGETDVLYTAPHPASPTVVGLTVAFTLLSAAGCIFFVRVLSTEQRRRFQHDTTTT